MVELAVLPRNKQYFGNNNKYTGAADTSCRVCTNSSCVSFAFTSQFSADMMYVNNAYPNVPDTLALRCSSSANTQFGRMASVSKWSVKMLEIPPVPLGIPCSKKCLSVAVGTTLPWPGESLNAEFKRPVLEISKTTAANVKPLWLKRNELS